MVARTLIFVVALAGCGLPYNPNSVTSGKNGYTLGADASYRHAVGAAPEVTSVATASARGRWFSGHGTPFAGGADVALGIARPSGVEWRAIMYGGVATRLGHRGFLGAVAGVGGSGITSHAEGALETPVEAFAFVEVGGGVGVALWAQPAWLFYADSRDGSGADVDAVRTGLTVRIGHATGNDQASHGRGLRVGVIYDAELGGRFLGVSLGYGVDGAVW